MVICFLEVAKGGVYACAAFAVVLGEFSAPPRMWWRGQTGLYAPCAVQGASMYNLYIYMHVCVCRGAVMDLCKPGMYFLVY